MRNIKSTILILMLISFAPMAVAAEDWPDVTVDGLHRIDNSRLAVVYADPEADLSPYQKVFLVDPLVAFKQNWLRDQRRTATGAMKMTSSDVERIKRNLAALFRDVFTTALQEAGYVVTEEAAEDVLLVRPAIINLDVYAPDVRAAGRTMTYTQSAGEMTLYVELYDSVSEDLLVKAIDPGQDRYSSYYTWSNSATNRNAATRIIKGWAEILVNALDEAHGGVEEE